MKIDIDNQFNPGDTIHEVWWSDEIAAWKVEAWEVYNIVLSVKEDGEITFGYNTFSVPEIVVPQSDQLFTTGTAAVNEARRRNQKLHGVGG